MSKQPMPPPPGDRPIPTAPPPPPAWRHWLWPIALGLVLLVWIFLPAVHSTPQVTLTYSQFLSDVSAHKVKTVTIASSSTSNATATGTLTNGHDYTTVIPVQLAGPSLQSKLQAGGVQITAAEPGSSFGSVLLSWLILLAVFLLPILLWRRLSRGAAGGGPLGGVLGVGRSPAKVFDAERPTTKFSDVAGYEGAKAEISEVVDFLRHPDRRGGRGPGQGPVHRGA
jgi:cell division protease FtsH